MKKFQIAVLLLLVGLSSCVAKKNTIRVQKSVYAYSGEGKVIWNGKKENFSRKFYFLITRDGNLRLDFTSFWGTLAIVTRFQNIFTLFVPIKNFAMKGKDIEIEGIPLNAIFLIIKNTLWNRNYYSEGEDEDRRFYINGRISGVVNIRNNIEIIFSVKDHGHGRIIINSITPEETVDFSKFKLSLPPDVRMVK